MFIIPYDLGLDGYLDAKQCKNRRRCTDGHPEAVEKLLLSMPYYNRYQGKGGVNNEYTLLIEVLIHLHLTTHSTTSTYPSTHPLNLFLLLTHLPSLSGGDHVVLWSLGQYHPWPFNHCDLFMRDFCAKCSFTCYWMDPTKANNRFVSVPFPAAYHWWDGIKELPWVPQHGPDARYVRNMTGSYR